MIREAGHKGRVIRVAERRPNSMEERDESSTPSFSAIRRRCCRCSGLAATAHRRSIIQATRCASLVGFPPGGPTDIFARLIGQWLSDTSRPTVRGRKSPGGRQHDRNPGCRVRAARRLHATPGQHLGSYQCLVLQEPEFQHDARHRAGLRHFAMSHWSWWSIRPFRPKQFPNSSPTRKANPGKIVMASVRQRHHAASGRRAVHDDGRCRSAPCPSTRAPRRR